MAVAGQVTEPSGAAHLRQRVHRPGYRGRGLAREACTRIMPAAIADGAPMLVLEMYAANEAGRRAYAALGFAEVRAATAQGCCTRTEGLPSWFRVKVRKQP